MADTNVVNIFVTKKTKNQLDIQTIELAIPVTKSIFKINDNIVKIVINLF